MNTSKISESFATAIARGIAKPKIRLVGYTFSLAPSTGRNPNAIYVKNADREYLGKIVDNQFYPSAAANTTDAAEIAAAVANPEEAAKAYGMRTGQCSICGRTLIKGESIDRGIGPICAANLGW